MKVQILHRTAVYIAGCVLSVSTAITGTGCVSSAMLAAKQPAAEVKESFSFELQPVANSSTVKLVVQKPIGKRLWITFKAPDGMTIERFCTEKRVPGIYRNYNFSEASEGTYCFEITDGTEKVTKFVRLEFTVPTAVQRLTVE